MSSDSSNPLEERRIAQEEQYFHKQNQEAAARLKLKAELNELGIDDNNLIDALGKAGFDRDSARVLMFIPLLEVVWADGKAQYEEKTEVLRLANEKGIDAESKAYALLSSWLSKKPSDEAFTTGQTLLAPIIKNIKEKHPDARAWVLESSKTIASSAGGLFGFGNLVSSEEEAVLKNLTDKL